MTKATTAEGDQRRIGPSWVTSRRAILKIFDNHLECGNWTVNYSEIRNAKLYSFRSPVLRVPGYILTVETDDLTYHFGLNGWGKFWKGDLPFDVKREQGKLGFTWFSVIVRVVLAACIAYKLWEWISSG